MRSVDFLTPIRRRARLNKGLLRWWRAEPKRNASPRLRDLTSKSPMTLSGALRLGQRGLAGAAGASVFNGTSDYGQTAAIDFSALSTMTVAMWVYWDDYATNGRLLLETGPLLSTQEGGIVIAPNAGAPGGFFDIGIRTGLGGSDYQYYRMSRPSALTWHHYAMAMNRNGGASQITFYVDGVAQSLTTVFAHTASTGGFGNLAWNFMSRNGGASGEASGKLDDIRVYDRVLPAWEVRALLHASRRGYPQELRWSRGAEFGGEAAEVPDPYIPYSVPYHRRSFKAMAPIKNAGHAMGTLSSAVPLTTIPGNALRARVVGVSGSATVYFREDGGTPSAANGTPIGAGGYADIVGRNNLEGFMAIEASPSGTLWVEYFDSVE